MKPNKLTKTQKVKNLLYVHPDMSAKEIATRVGCDVAMVYQIRKVRVPSVTPVYKETIKQVIDTVNNRAPTAKENIAKTIDMVNNPPHYTVGGIETIDYIKAKLTPEEYRGFLKGTILGYASRLGHKDGTDDAGKIGWYAKKLGEVL